MKKMLIISNLITFVSGLMGYFILKYALPQFFFQLIPNYYCVLYGYHNCFLHNHIFFKKQERNCLNEFVFYS